MKCLIINDGDIYGYIFAYSLFNMSLERSISIDIEFIKLPDSKEVVNDNLLLNQSLQYMNRSCFFNNIDISTFNAVYAINQQLCNFFEEDAETYLNYNNGCLRHDAKEIAQYMEVHDSQYDVDNLYYQNILAKNDLFDSSLINSMYNITFDSAYFVEQMTTLFKSLNNFTYRETDLSDDIFKTESNGQLFFFDNTYDNVMTNAEYSKSGSKFQFKYDRQIKNPHKYIEEDILNFEKIEFSNKEIKQTISSFDSNIETIYLKNDSVTNDLNSHVYQNNVFNIGVAFCKYNFSFHLDQFLHFYVLDKVSTFILNNKRNFSYLKSVHIYAAKIMKNIDMFLHKLLVCSGQLEELPSYNFDLLQGTNIDFLNLKYFNVDRNNFTESTQRKVFDFISMNKPFIKTKNYKLSNQYVYLMQHQYKQDLSLKTELLYV